jgi:hypothetical protein
LFDRPVIVLAAPRSGSTLLFETLAEAPGVWTVGGESHQFIEGIRSLNPRSGRVASNRLEAGHATQNIIDELHRRFKAGLRDRDENTLRSRPTHGNLRFLEKTPKNALRQPFLEKVFPGALYIYLYREPEPSISSMMEAWKSGRWVTYPRLRGWRGPAWSLLLPPGYSELSGRTLGEICAFQWESANRIILDDLEKLPNNRWTACTYDELVSDPEALIHRICDFADLEVDGRLQQRISGDLPHSRFTHTPPDPAKWRKNEAEILPVIDSLAATRERCLQVLETTKAAGKTPCSKSTP